MNLATGACVNYGITVMIGVTPSTMTNFNCFFFFSVQFVYTFWSHKGHCCTCNCTLIILFFVFGVVLDDVTIHFKAFVSIG